MKHNTAILILLLSLSMSSCSPQEVYHTTTEQLKSNHIPDEIFKLTQLKELSVQGMDCDYVELDDKGNDMTKCWAIAEIPSEIKELQQLEVLRLNVNAIAKLPPELSALQQLKTLDLSDNLGLSDIRAVTKLSKLENLLLFGCRMNQLPQDIVNLKKLKYLGLTGNNISEEELNSIRTALPDCEIVMADQ